jgi:preprotein translocase subunit SecA
MRDLERRVLLSVLDRKWREHLYEMDYLKEGIGLRAMAQRDPLVEYQREGYDMFRGMLDGLKEESVGFLFNVTVEAVPAPAPSVSVASEAQIAAAARQLAAARAASAPAVDDAGAAPDEAAPAAPAVVRAKGLEERSAPALTYSGPDEDGGTAVSSAPAEALDGQPAGRRDRRAAARTQAKGPRASRKK